MTNLVATHPLTQMLDLYCAQYPVFRDNNLDLQSLAFHKRFGLAIQVPFGWDVLSSVKYLLSENEFLTSRDKIIVVFGSTTAYRKIHAVLGDSVQYLSWHEIYTGMHIASTDARYIQRARALLDKSDLILFIDPPHLPEVLDQVRGQTTGALIVITGAGTNE